MSNLRDLGLCNDKIVSVERTSGDGAPGTVDVYTITLRSGSTHNFSVTNGNNGESGSPKGVYATLGELQAAYPAGTNGIYIVSANGHWYHWDSNLWQDGGVYQATAIANNSITPAMTKFLVERGNNLFNKWDVTKGYFRYAGTGELNPDINHYASNYIAVSANTTYSMAGLTSNAHICFFDSNKTFLSGMVSLANTTFTTPNNCAYMCMSDQLQTLDTMIIETSYSSAYYDYYKLLSSIINVNDLARIIIVDITGKNGAFTSLAKACDFATSGDTILVMPGDYINESCNCWNKKLSIIGVNKNTCRIMTNNATYQTPMFNMQIGMLANLSILMVDGASNAYCIHSENLDQVDEKFIINNCNIISNTGTCIGCGMRKGYELLIENCYIEGRGNACIYVHDAYDDNYLGDMYPTIINCELIANDDACLVIQSQEKEGTIVHLTIEKTSMITNAIHTYRVVNYEGGTSTDQDDFLGCINWRLDKRSWGNRENIYNYDNQ